MSGKWTTTRVFPQSPCSGEIGSTTVVLTLQTHCLCARILLLGGAESEEDVFVMRKSAGLITRTDTTKEIKGDEYTRGQSVMIHWIKIA